MTKTITERHVRYGVHSGAWSALIQYTGSVVSQVAGRAVERPVRFAVARVRAAVRVEVQR